MSTQTFQVLRADLARTRVVTAEAAPLAPGQVRVRVARFAFTANNITYAAFGQAMRYWQFYPASEADGQPAPEWGCIPVWGFAQVVQSLHPGVAVGERLWGYWPMASHAVLTPTRLTEHGFVEGATQRAELAAVYNQVLRCNRDGFYSADTEDLQALLRPLYLTAWLIDDFLADNAFFGSTAQPGATAALKETPGSPKVPCHPRGAGWAQPGPGGAQKPLMLLSSASSKTAWSTAARLAERDEVEVVGLTSAANLAYCQGLGCYARVLGYDQLEQLPADVPCIYVDFAGSAPLRAAVHQRFSRLAYSCSIGGTHVQDLGKPGGAGTLPGPKPTLFFAPAQVKKRSADWGASEFNRRLVASWQAFGARLAQAQPPWLVVQHHEGAQAVAQAYQQVLAGADPRVGVMLAL